MDALWIEALGGRDFIFANEWPLWAWMANLGLLVALWVGAAGARPARHWPRHRMRALAWERHGARRVVSDYPAGGRRAQGACRAIPVLARVLDRRSPRGDVCDRGNWRAARRAAAAPCSRSRSLRCPCRAADVRHVAGASRSARCSRCRVPPSEWTDAMRLDRATAARRARAGATPVMRSATGSAFASPRARCAARGRRRMRRSRCYRARWRSAWWNAGGRLPIFRP